MANYMNALMDPAQIGQMVSGSILAGAQAAAVRNYSKNPSMGSAGDVMAFDPRLGLHLQDREAERQAAQEEARQKAYAANLRQRAAQGDQEAMVELSGVDFNAWRALDDNGRQDTKERVDAIGQAAFAVAQLPPGQRPQAWDAYTTQLAQRWPELGQYVGRYSEEGLNSAIAQAKLVKDVLERADPKYMAIPQGGTLVNTRDPSAVAQFGAQAPAATAAPEAGGQAFTFEQYSGAVNSLGPQGAAQWLQRNGFAVQVQTPDQARQLPSGTPIILPDGSPGRVPGGAGIAAGGNFPEPLVPGNLPTDIRYRVRNSDGSISTVRTLSIGTDQGEVLIPTVIDGRVVSDDEAIRHFQQTGENFGTFKTIADADAYAEALHRKHAQLLGDR